MQEQNVTISEVEVDHSALEAQGKTVMILAVDGAVAGLIAAMDTVKENAVEAIEQLKAMHLEVAMLTGDNERTAKAIPEQLGISEVIANVLPWQKAEAIKKLQGEGKVVAMVGDGINDAPALAASDVGIAMGAHGVDVALESADVVLVKDELAQIPYLLKLSQKTMTIAKQNIAASLVVKLILGALGLMGLTPLWFTVASGDDGVTMLLLLNTLRLERIK
jgi:Cu+-exporting ATPase